MKRVIRNNLLVFSSYFLTWILIDFIDVKWRRFPSFEYELSFVLVFVLASFVWVNKSLVRKVRPSLRYLIISLIASIMTALWFALTVYMVIQFHMAIGGHL
jgi:hypothetical protein